MIIEEIESGHISTFLNSPVMKGVEADILEALTTAREKLDEAQEVDEVRRLQGRIHAYKEFLSLREGLQEELRERSRAGGAE